MLNIRSAQDIQRVFGLSCEASDVRWREYLKWKRTRRKTAWENDMKRLYKMAGDAGLEPTQKVANFLY